MLSVSCCIETLFLRASEAYLRRTNLCALTAGAPCAGQSSKVLTVQSLHRTMAKLAWVARLYY